MSRHDPPIDTGRLREIARAAALIDEWVMLAPAELLALLDELDALRGRP